MATLRRVTRRHLLFVQGLAERFVLVRALLGLVVRAGCVRARRSQPRVAGMGAA
jgi:hypothetical protein